MSIRHQNVAPPTPASRSKESIVSIVLLVVSMLAWLLGYTVALVVGWPAQWVRDQFIRSRYHLIYRNDPGSALLRLRKLMLVLHKRRGQ